MIPLKTSKLYIVEGIEEDPLTRERARRLETGLRADTVEHVGDAELNDAVKSGDLKSRFHGMKAEIEPVVVFNRYRFDDPPDVREKRKTDFPELFKKGMLPGYQGIDWCFGKGSDSSNPNRFVCPLAMPKGTWKIHTITGCHFRCAYCDFGTPVTIMMNLEDLVDRLDEAIEKSPNQTLYQCDNGTDNVCFEPEYGAAKLLTEYFAKREKEYLELYVGKSDHIDYMLDLDHRGHTVCCWSISGETQSTEFEWKTASMRKRIEAARLCQEAGYHVRFRFSPIIPVRNWQAENTEMIESIFAEVQPDVITFETLRFMDYEAINRSLDTSLLDPEFLSVMAEAQGEKIPRGFEIPHSYREKVYRFIIDELERVSPETPYALCRERQAMWDDLADDFARHGQSPDSYVCNCGTDSAPGNKLLRTMQV